MVEDSRKFAELQHRKIREWVIKVSANLGVDQKQVEMWVESISFSTVDGLGDSCLSIPRLRLGEKGAEYAQNLVNMFVPDEWISGVQIEKSYLNFTWNRERLAASLLPWILKCGEEYGRNMDGGQKMIVLDFGSPNIAKPFHAGHLRSTVIGNFLSLIHRANGYETKTINYLGDWGRQYGMLAIGYMKYGSKNELEKDAIRHLYDVYVQISKEGETDENVKKDAREYFSRMESGDKESLSFWKHLKDISIKKYTQIYEMLNIKYDVYSGESLYGSRAKDIVTELENGGHVSESDGAKIVDLRSEDLGVSVLIKSDGTSLYLTRDIAAAIDRYEEHKFHRSLYVVGAAQKLHFRQLLRILEKMGKPFFNKCLHISYGEVSGMSTRKGTVVFLEDIINEVKDVMHGVMKRNLKKYESIPNLEFAAEKLAVSAIVIQDFSGKIENGYNYNINRMTSFEGDTGPYLQYTHARICSIERKAAKKLEKTDDRDFSSLEKLGCIVVSKLAKYPFIVVKALEVREPCVLVHYLMNLCHATSKCIEVLYVLGQPTIAANTRLELYRSTRIVLGNGMRLLGLVPLTHM